MAVNNIDTAWALLVHGVVGALEYREDLEALEAACPLLARTCRSARDTRSLWTKMDKITSRGYPVMRSPPKPLPIEPGSVHTIIAGMYRMDENCTYYYTITPRTYANVATLPTEEGKYTYFEVYEHFCWCNSLRSSAKYEHHVYYGDVCIIGPYTMYMCQKYADGAMLDLSRLRFTSHCDTRFSVAYLGKPNMFLRDEDTKSAVSWMCTLRGRVEGNEVVYSDSDFIIHSDSVANVAIFFALSGVHDDVYIKVRLNVPHLSENDVVYTARTGRMVGCYRSTGGIMPTYNPDDLRCYTEFRCLSEMLQGVSGRRYTLEEINKFLARDGVEYMLPDPFWESERYF